MFSKERQSSTLIAIMAFPDLVAHRGYALRYPENTLVAIKSAVRAGARYVEVDIQLTADKQPVLFHDRDLERLCGVAGKVHEHTLGRLRGLHASEFGRFGYRYVQTPVATLTELVSVLQHEPQVTAFVEIKRISIEHFGADSVLETVLPLIDPVKRQCVLISFSLECLLSARRRGWHDVGVILEQWSDRKNGMVRAIRPDYLFCDIESLPRHGRLHTAPARLVVYEITDPNEAVALAGRGISLVETFAIGEMLSAFELLRGSPA
ncbi:MAG: glycerophosphodiester phosphodiesterase family protein [Acidiferrobacterales bacterium]